MIQPHLPLPDYGLKDGECVSLLDKGVGVEGDGGNGDGTFKYLYLIHLPVKPCTDSSCFIIFLCVIDSWQ